MSSRQFTQFGGSGEIVTLDNINEYDDLPPLVEIDSPDVYEIRTGNLGTDYLVPVQDGSTDFNEWYSLVDGQIISDIPDSVVDNFEDHPDVDGAEEPFGPYEEGFDLSDFYTINGDYSRTQNTVREGVYSLESSETSGGNDCYSMPDDGLPRYPERGEAVEFWVYQDDSDLSPSFHFLMEDTPTRQDSYDITLSWRNDNFQILRWEDGDSTTIASESVPDQRLNEWLKYRFEMHEDGDLVFEVFDTDNNQVGSTVSANDTTHDNGGFGYHITQSGSGNTCYVDGIHVEEL